MAKKNKGHIYGTPLRLPGERGAQEGQSRAVPMEYLGAPLASERSGLFCFVFPRPASSDGLHKMFLTAYEMDFWLPTGTPSGRQETRLSMQSSREIGQNGPRLLPAPLIPLQNLSKASRSRLNCPAIAGPGNVFLADTCHP